MAVGSGGRGWAMSTTTPQAESAVDFAGMGFAVFPCRAGSKLPATSHGFKDATTDQTATAATWAQMPDANPAAATGAVSGIVVVDVDVKAGVDGLAAIEALKAKLGPLPVTAEAITPSGGRHLYFGHPGEPIPNSAGRLAPGVDVRGDGGYVLLPGASLPNGLYRWAKGRSLADVGLAELPPALAEEMKAPRPAAQTLTPARPVRLPTRASNLSRRLASYVAAAEPASEGQRNDTAFRLAGHLHAIEDGFDQRPSESEIVEAMRPWAAACVPPLPEDELARAVRSAMNNGTPREPKPASAAIGTTPAAMESPMPTFVTVGQLVSKFRELREPVIEGFLRRGELGNVIAAPKMRKSWLVLALAVCKTVGLPWLGREMKPGRVLLIDLELHPETLAKRLRDVLIAFGLSSDALGDRLAIETFRGRQVDAATFGPYFRDVGTGQFDLVIIDPLYRLIPAEGDENANTQMAAIFTRLIGYAEELNAGVMLVHHASKGSQSEKSTTDVGAGAGAQSRAADAHIVLREHKEPDAAVLSAVVRSWPPSPDVAMRWAYPRWEIAPDLDPTELKTNRRSNGKPLQPPSDPKETPTQWTPEAFVAEFVGPSPRSHNTIMSAADQLGLKGKPFENLLKLAQGRGLIFRHKIEGDRQTYFATSSPQLIPAFCDSHSPPAPPHPPERAESPSGAGVRGRFE